MRYKKILLGIVLMGSIIKADDILKFSYISPDNIVRELITTPKNIKNCEVLKGFKENMLEESVYKDFEEVSTNDFTVKYSTCSYMNQLKIIAYSEYKEDKRINQASWNVFIKKGEESVGKLQTNPDEKKIFILKYE